MSGSEEKPRAKWLVVPRVEKNYLPGAMVPTQRIVGYDLVEYYDGTEVRRHEYATQFEAEVFGKIAKAEYKKHLEKRGDPPSPWLVAAFWAVAFVFAIAVVKLALHVAGVD